MKKLTLLLFMFSVLVSYSQEQKQYQNLSPKKTIKNDFHSQVDIGLGLGINYGGLLGAQVQYIPTNHFGIMGSAGYYLAGFGWQVGGIGYIMPKIPSKPFRVYGTVMYGTNAAILIIGSSQYNSTFMGPSIGGGIEMRFGREKRKGLNIDLFVPFRSNEYNTAVNNVKNDPSISDFSEPLPFTISVGYHFEIK